MVREYGDRIPLNTPNTVLLGKFWSNIASGKHRNLTEIEAIDLSKHYFEHEPMLVLYPEEEQSLKRELSDKLQIHLNDGLVALCKNPIVHVPKGDKNDFLRRFDPHFLHSLGESDYFLAESYARYAMQIGYVPLTNREKVTLFSDPTVFEEAKFTRDRLQRGTIGYGSRPFFLRPGESCYGFEREEFRQIVEEIIAKKGNSLLKVADIGGNTGLACYEIKHDYPNFEFTNVTITEEPAMWPGINHEYIPAERLPAKWYESFDIIVSNMAWRYFMYPDLALKNLLLALNVGGYANLDYRADSSPLQKNYIELVYRMNQAYGLLKDLMDQEYIDFELNRGIYQTSYPKGHLVIRKLKSIPIGSIKPLI